MDLLTNNNIKITRNAIILQDKKGFHSYSANKGFLKILGCSKGFHSTIRKFNFYIKPIKDNGINVTNEFFSSMDVETMEYNNIQIPVAISIAYNIQ
jgi:hypothetical protein